MKRVYVIKYNFINNKEKLQHCIIINFHFLTDLTCLRADAPKTVTCSLVSMNQTLALVPHLPIGFDFALCYFFS